MPRDQFEECLQEMYAMYLDQECYCHVSDNCECVSFDKFVEGFLGRRREAASFYEDCDF